MTTTLLDMPCLFQFTPGFVIKDFYKVETGQPTAPGPPQAFQDRLLPETSLWHATPEGPLYVMTTHGDDVRGVIRHCVSTQVTWVPMCMTSLLPRDTTLTHKPPRTFRHPPYTSFTHEPLAPYATLLTRLSPMHTRTIRHPPCTTFTHHPSCYYASPAPRSMPLPGEGGRGLDWSCGGAGGFGGEAGPPALLERSGRAWGGLDVGGGVPVGKPASRPAPSHGR